MKYFKIRMLRHLIIGAVLAPAAALFVMGCNTVEGAGEDIEAVGEGVSDAADGDR